MSAPKAFWPALVLLLGAGQAFAAQPQLQPTEYQTRYEVFWGSMNLGRADISLQRLDDGCYRYQSITHAGALVRMFYGEPREVSEFCLVNGEVRSRYLQFVNDKKKKDSFELRFDWQAGTVAGPGQQQRELPANAVDRFSMQEALRLWVMRHVDEDTVAPLELTMVEDDRMRAYTFERVGERIVQTPAGALTAVLVERSDDPKKTVRFWFAPERGFQIVRFERLKDGKPAVEMLLAE